MTPSRSAAGHRLEARIAVWSRRPRTTAQNPSSRLIERTCRAGHRVRYRTGKPSAALLWYKFASADLDTQPIGTTHGHRRQRPLQWYAPSAGELLPDHSAAGWPTRPHRPRSPQFGYRIRPALRRQYRKRRVEHRHRSDAVPITRRQCRSERGYIADVPVERRRLRG